MTDTPIKTDHITQLSIMESKVKDASDFLTRQDSRSSCSTDTSTQAALEALEELANTRMELSLADWSRICSTIRAALQSKQSVNQELLEALKYAHSQMQPFCDDTIVKQAIALADQKGQIHD